MLSNTASEFLARLKDAVADVSAIGRLSHWIEKNTTLGGKPYSFKGHEYQREIIDSIHPNSGVIKPSQTGVTEASSRLMLAFVGVSSDVVGLYLLPTLGEALRFSKSRLDTTIRGSDYLNKSIIAGSDSASFKQIGGSQIYVGGTWGKAVISIPVDLLVIDEFDFCNAENCTTAESRLSHSKLFNETLDMRGVRRRFSTPTVPGYGVSAIFEQSNQLSRLVKCKHCGEWFWPSFLDHCVVQGFDRSFHELDSPTVDDLDQRGLLETAELLCEHCHKPITKANLQPEYRQWVAARPEVKHTECWRVSPFDLPDYHNPNSLLRKLKGYGKEIGHYRNFTLGLPYSDASNSVLADVVANNAVLAPEYPNSTTASETIIGLDVGKTSWLTVGKLIRVDGIDTLHIIWAERITIRANEEDSLVSIVKERIKQFKAIKVVVDGLPYTSSMLQLQGLHATGLVLICMYTLNDRKLPPYVLNENTYVVDSNRTKVINNLVTLLNKGLVKFAVMPELKTIESHLQGMRRVDSTDEKGNYVSSWVKTGEDHFFHSLTYLSIAASEIQAELISGWTPKLSLLEATVGKYYRPPVYTDNLLH